MANPIKSIGGKSVKSPSTYVVTISDLSNSEAGRSDSGMMYKLRMGTCRKIELSWKYLTTEEISTILNAVYPEYFTCMYLDPLTGMFRGAEFYRGDIQAPLYNAEMDRWESLSFNIIERAPT